MPDRPLATIDETARALGMSARQVRRDIAAGAPVARRGGRGRTNTTLIDLDAFAAWRSGSGNERQLHAAVAAIPELIATAMWDAFVATYGPHKQSTARVLVHAGLLAIAAVLDRLDLPEPSVLPGKLDTLRHISGDSRMVGSSSPPGVR